MIIISVSQYCSSQRYYILRVKIILVWVELIGLIPSRHHHFFQQKVHIFIFLKMSRIKPVGHIGLLVQTNLCPQVVELWLLAEYIWKVCRYIIIRFNAETLWNFSCSRILNVLVYFSWLHLYLCMALLVFSTLRMEPYILYRKIV